ncbi:MAG: sigma-70 family RNA polymerase sigma factor, partial [Saprospiraceae bacterium]|nr:sigma-70 family RNA polymerase sigma factor [Saprospiraceae bacterium]
AVWWIRQSILQAIVEYSRLVRLPLNKVGQYNKVNEAITYFTQEFEREPSVEELADLLDMSVNEISTVLKGSVRHLSVDAPISDDDDNSTLLDMMSIDNEMGPDLKLMEESLQREVNSGLSLLSPREVDVLVAYYGLNGMSARTLEEIGEMYGLTRERVRQIKERALRRLRRSYNRNALRSYLGS